MFGEDPEKAVEHYRKRYILGSDQCRTCGRIIQAMVFRGTGYCSQKCQKDEAQEQQAKADYATEASLREPTD